MTFLRNMERFAERKLSMRAKHRKKSPILIPPGIHLPPFLQIRWLWLMKALLHQKATGVHRPIRRARHRKIDTCANLIAHIMPTRCNVTTPSGRTITLLPSKIRTGQYKHPVVGVCLALPLINTLCMHQGKSVIITYRRTSGRLEQRFSLLEIDIRMYIGLASIHPPGVNPFFVQFVIHKIPKPLPGSLLERIIKSGCVALTNPVFSTIVYIARV